MNYNGLMTTALMLEKDSIMQDDVGLLYKVVETHSTYCVLEKFPNVGNFSCELMTYKAMQDEDWTLVAKAY